MIPAWVRPLFAAVGAYDAGLGLAFLFFGPQLLDVVGAPAPGHGAYLQFACVMLVIFGGMFFAVAARPAVNRNLIPYGMTLKLGYAALAVYHWATTGVPLLFGVFGVIDALVFFLFAVAYRELGRHRG